MYQIKTTDLPTQKKIQRKNPNEILNFRGKPTPTTKIPKVVKKKLPEALREDIIEHLTLINKLNEEVNDLVRKATKLFYSENNSSLSKERPYEEERRKPEEVMISEVNDLIDADKV